MAIVNGPLFSLDASGQVGKALVYTKWKGRNVVREYVTPANPNSPLQRGRRTWVKLLNMIWQGMDSTDRDSWADLAAAGNYSNFNGFTSYNLDEQTSNNAPTKNRSDTPTTITAEFTQEDPFDTGFGTITGNIDVTTAQAGAYAVVTLTDDPSNAGVNELYAAAVFDATSTGTQGVDFSGLPAGTYAVSGFIVTEDGSKDSSAQWNEEGLVVTG